MIFFYVEVIHIHIVTKKTMSVFSFSSILQLSLTLFVTTTYFLVWSPCLASLVFHCPGSNHISRIDNSLFQLGISDLQIHPSYMVSPRLLS